MIQKAFHVELILRYHKLFLLHFGQELFVPLSVIRRQNAPFDGFVSFLKETIHHACVAASEPAFSLDSKLEIIKGLALITKTDMNSDWFYKRGVVDERRRAQAWGGPMDPNIMYAHMGTIPHMAGEENGFTRIPMNLPQIREAYASRLAEDTMRMTRYMGTEARARRINLNVGDPLLGLTITPGSNWLEKSMKSTTEKYGKSRMVVDPEILRRLPY